MWEKVYHKRNLCPSKSLFTRKKFTQKVVQIKSHNWWWEETKWNFETHQSLPSWTLVDLCIFSLYICIKFDAASWNRTLIYLIKSVIVCFLHFLLRNLSLFDKKRVLVMMKDEKQDFPLILIQKMVPFLDSLRNLSNYSREKPVMI